MGNRKLTLQFALFSVTVFSGLTLGVMTPIFNNANVDMDAVCNGLWTPGGTTLTPFTNIARGNLTSFADMLNTTQDAMHNQTGYAGPSYSYQVAPQGLNGDLYVELYKAYDWEDGDYCYHGAGLVLDYDWDIGDSIGLEWVQFFDETGDARHFSDTFGTDGWIMDGFEDDDPAYWAETDFDTQGALIGSIPGNASQDVERNNWTFLDYPYYRHDEPSEWQGGMNFQVFLTDIEWMGQDQSGFDIYDITIYEGYSWGYEGICTVPAPGAFALGVMGTAFVTWLRKRRTI